MDEFYDQASAANRLEEIIRERASSDLYLASSKMDDYSVHSFTQPRAWRLCSGGGPDEALEEACFRVQGILCGKDLPPVVLTGARASRIRSRKFIRQNVKLTGFGNEDMAKGIQMVEAAYLKMLNHFQEGALEPWQPSSFDGNPALEANTRYLTQAIHAEASDVVDFAPHVDADGQLRAIMEPDYVHTTDNRVEYMEQLTNHDGTKTYRTVDPVVFKHGDIVEATISFAVIKTKNKTAKLHVMLRALAMIDHTARDAAAILKMRQRYKPVDFGVVSKAKNVLKRKATYYDGEIDVEEAHRGLHRMRIDAL